jgi:hypothetical protein
MAVWAIGLTPIFPTIEVPTVVEIPDLVRTTKLAAEPRLTGVCVAALAVKLRVLLMPSIRQILKQTISIVISILFFVQITPLLSARATSSFFAKTFLLPLFPEPLLIQISPINIIFSSAAIKPKLLTQNCFLGIIFSH